MTIEHIVASGDAARMVAALQRDGAVIVEGYLAPTCWPASTPRSSRSWR
jgi:hypothetical protein